MLTDKEIISIILVESLGIVSFLLALIFFEQSRKISDTQEGLKKATVDKVRNGPCYSYKWIISHTLKPRKMLKATPSLAVLAYFIMWFWFFFLGPWIFFYVTPYLAFTALIGIIILLKTDAFEAYSYGRAVQKAPLDHLNGEDQSYMELARKALEKAVIRFLIIGIIYVVVGPFIPQIFDGLIYVFGMYTVIIFESEVSLEISIFLAFVITAVLIIILLYFPELMNRIIFRRVKLQAQRIWKRWRKR